MVKNKIDFKNDEYIILELIPEAFTKEKGSILQVSALKLKGLVLIDRFDYRLNEDQFKIKEFLNMLDYDKESFVYVENDQIILEKLKEFVGDLDIMLLDNTYTLNFLDDFNNNMELVFDYFDIEYTDHSFQDLIKKYNLEESSYLVDLVYEALIYKSNEIK